MDDPSLIIPARPEHANALAEIHATAFAPAEAWSATDFAKQLGLPGAFGAIDQRGGMVLGRVAAGQAEILTLAVAPEMRRQGVGRALLHCAMGDAAARGALLVFLEVSTANLAARNLYASARFDLAGRRLHYYADGTDALVLQAKVSPFAKAAR